MSVIHFQLILVMGVRTVPKLIFFFARPVVLAPFSGMAVFCPFALSLFLFPKIY